MPETHPSVLASIECRDLTFSVRAPEPKVILDHVNLTARAGEIVGICGPNGAGKSTLLRVLAGLAGPVGGEVRINGRLLAQYHPRQLARQLSFLPQDTTVPFDFRAREIVLMGRHPYASSLAAWSDEDQTVARRCLELADCAAEAEQFVTTLSGGERQRVMIARLLAQDTPIVLLDEMTASQDINHASQLLKLTQSLAKAGKLVILVLHDLRAAARICTRVCLMHEGRLVADGEPAEVLLEGHIAYLYGVRVRTFTNPLGHWDYDLEES